MITDWMKDLEVGIPALLEDGINMLIYAGEYDLICNWLGNFPLFLLDYDLYNFVCTACLWVGLFKNSQPLI